METLLNLRQIDQLTAWGGKFLRAASTKPEIMQLMMGLGYSEQEHKLGWELYLKMLGYRGAGAMPAPISMSTTEQLNALSQIDRFDEPAFRRATARIPIVRINATPTKPRRRRWRSAISSRQRLSASCAG